MIIIVIMLNICQNDYWYILVLTVKSLSKWGKYLSCQYKTLSNYDTSCIDESEVIFSPRIVSVYYKLIIHNNYMFYYRRNNITHVSTTSLYAKTISQMCFPTDRHHFASEIKPCVREKLLHLNMKLWFNTFQILPSLVKDDACTCLQ